jgi:hypothetical protein
MVLAVANSIKSAVSCCGEACSNSRKLFGVLVEVLRVVQEAWAGGGGRVGWQCLLVDSSWRTAADDRSRGTALT